MTHTFVTHARTLDELREEVLSDLRRRLASLDTRAKYEKNARESAKLGFAQQELTAMLEFWQCVELRGSRVRAGRVEPGPIPTDR